MKAERTALQSYRTDANCTLHFHPPACNMGGAYAHCATSKQVKTGIDSTRQAPTPFVPVTSQETLAVGFTEEADNGCFNEHYQPRGAPRLQ